MLFVITRVDVSYETLGASPAVFVMMRHFEPKHFFFSDLKVFLGLHLVRYYHNWSVVATQNEK